MRNSAHFPLLLAIALLAVVLVSCRHEPTPRQAAEQFYGYLCKGDVDAYMQSMADYDSLPAPYRSELRDMFMQYLQREQQLRQGILSAQAVRDTLVSDRLCHVFLLVTYGDSTQEQVSLPLVLTDRGWRMK